MDIKVALWSKRSGGSIDFSRGFSGNNCSCVHPRSITGFEIQNGEITLIKWFVKSKEDGLLQIAREVIVGPKKL